MEWPSRLKKKFEHQRIKQHKSDRTGDESGGKSVDPAISFARPLPHVETSGGHNREDGGRQVLESKDSLLPPDIKQAPTCGGDNGHEGEGTDVDGGKVSHIHSHPHFEVATGSRPGHGGGGTDQDKIGQGYPSLSTLPISHSGQSDDST